MKKTILNIIVLTILTISCKREDLVRDESASYWIVNGTTYKGFAETHPLGSAFDAVERKTRYGISTGNFISIEFYYGYMPAKSGIYKVMEYPNDSSQCKVTVRIEGVSSVNYTSLNSASEVTIDVSQWGKLSASFSNLVLSDYFTGNTIMVSGYLAEQY